MPKHGFLIVLFITAVACNCYAQTPAEINNSMQAITDSLFSQEVAWNNKFTILKNTTRNFAELAPIRTKLQRYITIQTNRIITMNAPDSKDVKQHMLHLLRFEKSMVDNVYMEFEKMNSRVGKDVIRKGMERLNDQTREQNKILSDLTAAQQEYLVHGTM